jgi:hypothetical protein
LRRAAVDFFLFTFYLLFYFIFLISQAPLLRCRPPLEGLKLSNTVSISKNIYEIIAAAPPPQKKKRGNDRKSKQENI